MSIATYASLDTVQHIARLCVIAVRAGCVCTVQKEWEALSFSFRMKCHCRGGGETMCRELNVIRAERGKDRRRITNVVRPDYPVFVAQVHVSVLCCIC